MVNAASITVSATVLPDNISKTIAGSMTVTPDDANDKWYYKYTSCTATSTDLIAGSFLDYTAVDDDAAPLTVATGDKVKFIYIKNVDPDSRSIYVTFDAGTVTSSLAQAVTIGPNESFYGRFPNATVADVHAISSASTAQVIVCALLDDVA